MHSFADRGSTWHSGVTLNYLHPIFFTQIAPSSLISNFSIPRMFSPPRVRVKRFRPCLDAYVFISIHMCWLDWSEIKLNFIPIHSNTSRLKWIHTHLNKALGLLWVRLGTGIKDVGLGTLNLKLYHIQWPIHKSSSLGDQGAATDHLSHFLYL